MRDVVCLVFHSLIRKADTLKNHQKGNAPAYFWQPRPETPKQPDVVDTVDAGQPLQGLETHDWRRPRQLRRLYCEFNPRGRPPFWHDSHNGIFLKNFGKFV